MVWDWISPGFPPKITWPSLIPRHLGTPGGNSCLGDGTFSTKNVSKSDKTNTQQNRINTIYTTYMNSNNICIYDIQLHDIQMIYGTVLVLVHIVIHHVQKHAQGPLELVGQFLTWQKWQLCAVLGFFPYSVCISIYHTWVIMGLFMVHSRYQKCFRNYWIGFISNKWNRNICFSLSKTRCL